MPSLNFGCRYQLQKFEICTIRELVDYIENRLDQMYKDCCEPTKTRNSRNSVQQERICRKSSQDKRYDADCGNPCTKMDIPPVKEKTKVKEIHHYQTLDGRLVCQREKPLNFKRKNPLNACQAIHGNVALCMCCHNTG